METIYLSWRITQSINDVCRESIGVVYHRAHPILRLNTISIQFCLMFPFYWRYCCLLCFYHCQWFSITSKQHIVCIPHIMRIWHPHQFHLYACLRFLYQSFCLQHIPSCLFQHQVYIQCSCFCFRNTHIWHHLYRCYRFYRHLIRHLCYLFCSLHR